MKSILFIKRNQELIMEEKIRRNFFRFLDNKGRDHMRKIVDDSSLGSMLNESIVNAVRENSKLMSKGNYEKLFEFAALLKKKWDKKKLKIHMIDSGDYNQEVINAFGEWNNCTNIDFIVADSIIDSDIRISFKRNDGHWSFIGKEVEDDSLIGQPTINFDPADLETLEPSTRFGIFLHEIGHSIGLIHEHQKETSPIIWNKNKVYEDCFNWNKWDANKVDHNIFSAFNSNDLFYSKEFDVKSIMIYAIPIGWSQNYQINKMNVALSTIDKEFAKAFYEI